jgi:hypothetical protein
VVGLSAGLADRLEIGVHMAYAADEESVNGGHAKIQVYRRGDTAIAVEANVLGTDGDDAVGLAAASLSRCLGSDCSSIATFHAGALVATDEGAEQQLPLLGGASLVAGDSTFKFVLEVYSLEIDHERLFGGMTGMRLSGRQLAFDLGIAFVAAGDGGGAVPVMGLTLRP